MVCCIHTVSKNVFNCPILNKFECNDCTLLSQLPELDADSRVVVVLSAPEVLHILNIGKQLLNTYVLTCAPTLQL